MRKVTFQKHINQLGEEDLREELMMLFGKVPEVAQYYKMELGTEKERTLMYEKAKTDIASKYKTRSYKKPRRPRIQKIKKIISELNKLTVFNYEMIDVYLFNTEAAITFHNEYNYYSTPLFNTILSSFESALDLIEQNMMADTYHERCKKIAYSCDYLYNELLTLFNDKYSK